MKHFESLRIEYTSALREALKSLTPPCITIKKGLVDISIRVWVDDGENQKLFYIITEKGVDVKHTFRLAVDAELVSFLFEEFNNILSLKIL